MTVQPDQPGADNDATEEQATARQPANDEVLAAEPSEPSESSDLDALKAQVDENWDKFVRAAAELENVRKRALRDVENARKFALEKFSSELLAVRDSLEMSLDAAHESDVDALRVGSEATLKLLASTMERFAVVELDPLGEPFDPEQHEAMTMQPSADVEPGTVLQVLQKGYALNGRLLRPARVVVAQEPPAAAEKH